MQFNQILGVVFASFLFLSGIISAQSDAKSLYRVLPEEGEFADREIMLLMHLSRIAQYRAWKREVEIARIRDHQDWEDYRSRLLALYKQVLHFPFIEKTSLKAEISGILDRGEYRIEKLLYQSMPGIFVTANLYVPQIGEGPFPGILFPCGHSENGKASRLYHSAALGLVKKGFVVLLYDPPGQGERYQYLEKNGELILPSPTREHTYLANPMFLIGEHLMAVRIWEAIRGIDYLQSREEVDPARIGVTGNSGGGTVALHLTPLEERIQVAVPVGTVGAPDLELGTGGISDGEQNLPFKVPYGITSADLMMLAWPRPYRLIKESRGGVRRGTRTAYVQAHHIYDLLGRGDRISLVETEWPHGYFQAMREPMYSWFGKWFYQREDDHQEPELQLEKEEELLCSKTGQIVQERGIPLWRWTAQVYETNFPEWQIPNGRAELAEARSRIEQESKGLFNNPDISMKPVAKQLGTVRQEGLEIEKLAIYSEEDIYLPALFVKRGPVEKSPVVVIVSSNQGREDLFRLARGLSERGCAALIVDLRGLGETRITRRSSRDESGGFEALTLGVEAGVAYDGLKLGRPIFAMRLFDLQQVFNYLVTRQDVNQERLAVAGVDSCGPLALYAAALDDRVQSVLLDRSLNKFSDLVTNKMYEYHFLDFLPRVLRYHDLPQVAGVIAPRPVWLLNTLDAVQVLEEGTVVKNSYHWAIETYQNVNAGSEFQIDGYEGNVERADRWLAWARAACLIH